MFALWIRTTVETKRIKETPGVAPSCLLLFALCFLGLLCLYVPSPSYLLGPKSSASHTQSGDASYWGSPPPVLLGALVSEIACYTVFIWRGHEGSDVSQMLVRPTHREAVLSHVFYSNLPLW